MDKLDIKKKRVMMYFIEATQELILNEGIENLSIKKIAEMYWPQKVGQINLTY